MSNQAANFIAAYLGDTANVPPSEAARKRMRDVLLTHPLDNPQDAGAQASHRNFAGTLPHAYCLHHKAFTAHEIEPMYRAWVEFERDHRGLGGDVPYPPKMTDVYKSTHFTNIQHLVIAATSESPETRKLALKQAVQLRGLILKDGVVTEPDWMGPSRGIGWSAQGCFDDVLATAEPEVLGGVLKLLGRLTMGEEGGVPFIWRNKNALGQVGHLYECSPWMDSTAIKALALTVSEYTNDPALVSLLIHSLRCLQYAQREDGTFHDDYQPGQPGVFNESPGESTETWIWPALIAAKEALDDAWPVWAQVMLDRCKLRFMALNRFLPKDSGFVDAKTMGLAIYCAPTWGWRA